ncbi:MAG: type II toxin-antitoxin system Phd/YefM family antitoxin [Acidobacteriia bacterium]|nr:type II toxin-antitoxin system Phd/YefM family antitoxin [Terriglobia bacterium]
MPTITIQKAKKSLPRLIEQACRGEEVIIARGSELVVRLVPVTRRHGKRQPGVLRGKLEILPSFFEPLPDDELKRWE